MDRSERADPRGPGARQADRDGLHRLRAHHAARGRRGQGQLAGRAAAGVPAVAARARAVAAVRLGHRTTDRRAGHAAVLRVAGLVEVPGRAPGPGPDTALAAGLSGRHAAPDRWGTDLCADRQREDRDRRTHRPGPGPPPRRGHRRPPLRDDHPHLRPGGSADQGRLGGHRADREGRPGAHRDQPARRLRQFRRARGGLPAVLRPGQRRGRTGRPDGPRSRCWPRRRPGCTRCRSRRSRRRSARPAGSVGTPPSRSPECATQSRHSWSISGSGPGWPATSSWSPSSTRTGRARSPGTAADGEGHRRSATSTTRTPTRPAAPSRATAPREPPTPPRRRSWPSVPAPPTGSPRRPRPAPRGCARRWPRRCRWPSCTARPRSTRPSAPPHWPAGSPRMTWPRSWPTNATSAATRPAAGAGLGDAQPADRHARLGPVRRPDSNVGRQEAAS